MTDQERLELLLLLEEREKLKAVTKIDSYYPDTGPLRRELYPKHMQYFEAGIAFRERLFMAANRIGKTEGAGGYETSLHLTGRYPSWWKGRRFDKPVDWWASGNTGKTTRDIIQAKLFGPPAALGTGLIPKDAIVGQPSAKSGVPNAFDTAFIKHVSGGISQIQLKSYDQKRTAFEGTEKDGIWLDEEPPQDIYTECLLRTMTNNGLIMLTFTPLLGMSEVVLSFLPGGTLAERQEGSKFVIMATWDDVPHLTESAKKELWNSIPPFQRDARSKGIPQLGAGAIYPVPESDILVDDFQIPEHWPRGFAMDVGWNRTAAGFYALDRDNDVLYRTGEHYRGEAEPAIHAHAISSRYDWKWPGVIDPAARGRGQADGGQLLQSYIDLGLDLDIAFNGVESGIHEVWQRLSSGRLKVFRSCQNWLYEFRLYRRDEKGRIVKANDHAMDETRYMVMSGIDRMKTKPTAPKTETVQYTSGSAGTGWMG